MPLVELAASSGGVATPARPRDAIEGIGSPQDCLALARLSGGEALKRHKCCPARICGHVACPAHEVRGKAETNRKQCAGCHSVYYCDAQCQKGAWKNHKLVCAILKAAGEVAEGAKR